MITVDWKEYAECGHCGDLFTIEDDREAGVIDLEIVGVFHRLCRQGFQTKGRKVQRVLLLYGVLDGPGRRG